ncbi:MAG: spermidine/putrescine ABC transporter [Firmicutes bacterium HGW-Firmicutes-7]|nr:MAG: spermidine/putrescine ABC transporter [Firmicutes bacterium HGW-Firmicutes-7]
MIKNKSSMFVIIAITIYLIMPIVFTFFYSIFAEWNEVLPKGLTFRYYIQILTDLHFMESIGRTLFISILPIVLCTIVILLAMYVVIVFAPQYDKYIQVLSTIPYALQGVIIAISVLSLYADAPAPFSNRMVMLTGTYCILILPYMYQGIKNSLNTVNAPRLIEAAQMLGASRIYAFFAVIVPNILSGITVSALLSAAIIFGDFVIVNIIGGNYFETSQVYLYKAMFKSGQLTSAIGVVLFVITLLLSAGVYFIKNKKLNHGEMK